MINFTAELNAWKKPCPDPQHNTPSAEQNTVITPWRTENPARSPKGTTAPRGIPGTLPQGKEDLCPARTLQ